MGDKEEPTQISEWADEQKHANISTLQWNIVQNSFIFQYSRIDK